MHIPHHVSAEKINEPKKQNDPSVDENIPTDRAKFQEILQAALRKIESLEAQLNKARADRLLSNWETTISKVVVRFLLVRPLWIYSL